MTFLTRCRRCLSLFLSFNLHYEYIILCKYVNDLNAWKIETWKLCPEKLCPENRNFWGVPTISKNSLDILLEYVTLVTDMLQGEVE